MSAEFMEQSLSVLSRTPAVLDTLLRDLPEPWIRTTEGPGKWSPYVVIGHLVHAERTNWMPRLTSILEHGVHRPFEDFDREGQLRNGTEKSLGTLLDELHAARRDSLTRLRALNLQQDQLKTEGTHPVLGVVTVRQLIAAWTAHDLAHTVQITRTMARHYKEEVGPWAAFLSVMK